MKVYVKDADPGKMKKLSDFCGKNNIEIQRLNGMGRPRTDIDAKKVLSTYARCKNNCRETARKLGINSGHVSRIVNANK